MYDVPLRSTHCWFEVIVVETGYGDGSGTGLANISIGLSNSMAAGSPGLTDGSVGLDLSELAVFQGSLRKKARV